LNHVGARRWRYFFSLLDGRSVRTSRKEMSSAFFTSARRSGIRTPRKRSPSEYSPGPVLKKLRLISALSGEAISLIVFFSSRMFITGLLTPFLVTTGLRTQGLHPASVEPCRG